MCMPHGSPKATKLQTPRNADHVDKYESERGAQAPWSGDKSSLGLAKQPCRDVTHVRLLELIIFAVHAVNAYILEGSNDLRDIEAHGNEAVDEILVVATVPGILLIQARQSRTGFVSA